LIFFRFISITGWVNIIELLVGNCFHQTWALPSAMSTLKGQTILTYAGLKSNQLVVCKSFPLTLLRSLSRILPWFLWWPCWIMCTVNLKCSQVSSINSKIFSFWDCFLLQTNIMHHMFHWFCITNLTCFELMFRNWNHFDIIFISLSNIIFHAVILPFYSHSSFQCVWSVTKKLDLSSLIYALRLIDFLLCNPISEPVSSALKAVARKCFWKL